MRAQAVAAKVEGDDPAVFEQWNDAEPVAQVTREPVQEHDGRARAGVGVREPVHARHALTPGCAREGKGPRARPSPRRPERGLAVRVLVDRDDGVPSS